MRESAKTFFYASQSSNATGGKQPWFCVRGKLTNQHQHIEGNVIVDLLTPQMADHLAFQWTLRGW